MKQALNVFRSKTDYSITLSKGTQQFSLIWLHGLGDSSEGFFDFFQLPDSPIHIGARIKLLQAPCRPVSINNGMSCNSWFDIKGIGHGKDQDQYSMKQLRESLKYLDTQVQQQMEYWKGKANGDNNSEQALNGKIFVGGFSQGCAVSLLYGLTTKQKLGGVIGYSGFLFTSFDFVNKNELPMLLYHGKQDEMIDCRIACKGYEHFLKGAAKLSLRLIDIGHSVNEQQLRETTQWLKEIQSQQK